MKPSSLRLSRKLRGRQKKGFALIITLSLMILLTVVAVGLLGLSSITLRSTNQGRALATARSNARLAMMLALNDLQVNAGPDTRITAPASTLGATGSQEALVGVWKSRKLDPSKPVTSDKQTDAAKADDFLRWLVSAPDQNATKTQSFGQGAAPTGAATRKILSKRYAVDGTTEMMVASVPVKSTTTAPTTVSGRYAYAVFDEGAKARVNLGVTPYSGTALAVKSEQLGVGQRPGVERIAGVTAPADEKVDLSTSDGAALISKMMTLGNAGIAHTSDGKLGLEKHFNDVTPYSMGLLTDAANGGLKKDLNLLADASRNLPSGYGGNSGIYKTTFGSAANDIPTDADPLWSLPLKFANLYFTKNSKGDFLIANKTPGSLSPTVKATAPSDWSASSVTDATKMAAANTVTPTSPVLMPSIAKVQMIYSVHAHDLFAFSAGDAAPVSNDFINGKYNAAWKAKTENQWDNNWSLKNAGRDVNYQLWVFCTPIVTLHNPYNVAIEIPAATSNTGLQISFVNVPFAMKFIINGNAQTPALIPYSDMFTSKTDYSNVKSERRYTLTINSKNKSSSGNISLGSDSVTLLPGETRVFTPYMDPNADFYDTKNRPWYNVGNNSTGIKSLPGSIGPGAGFGQDQLSPAAYSPVAIAFDSQGRSTGKGRAWNNGIVLSGDEMIQIEFAPVPATTINNNSAQKIADKRFVVEMSLLGANTSAGAKSVVLDLDYSVKGDANAADGLQTAILGKGVTLKWPTDGPIKATDLRDHGKKKLSECDNMRSFALLSVYAKTTHGGDSTTGEDGRYPAKPWLFNSHTSAVSAEKIGPASDNHFAHYSHDINLEVLPKDPADDVIDIDTLDRGSFITGHTKVDGRTFGTMLEVPLGPLQSPVSLNGSNLAAGYYLPRFTAPIGNSFAHPVMPGDKIIADVSGQKYIDHSYLLNSVLFDGYYCSGLQTRGGNYGDGKTATELTESFLKGTTALTDTRLQSYLPDGESADAAKTAITGTEGYKSIASHQLLRGAFNVNSTSVGAWKAALSSMKGGNASIYAVTGSSDAAKIQDLAAPATTSKKGARFSRFRLPNGQPDTGDRDALWTAPRDLTEDELDKLAKAIVTEIKERGPFLSMGEFVNRQIGTSSQKTLVGALQAAIDNSGINKSQSSLGGYEIDSSKTANLKLANPDALVGSSAQGAPGMLIQSDILAVFGNAATVRSDTFVIRAYGEAGDGTRIDARAWCEAVVQRMPEYVDSKDAAAVAPADLTKQANKTFGRRFNIVSFRWLTQDEV